MGMAVQHFGARKCGVLGGVLFSGGLLVSVFATSVNFLIITFGVVSGRLYQFAIIQLLPLSEGDMTICSPETGNIARGRTQEQHLFYYTEHF